jgi:hypothetical protein
MNIYTRPWHHEQLTCSHRQLTDCPQTALA